MSKHTFEVTSQNFQQEVLDSDQPVLVDFWAEWCGPCRMIAPIVEQIASEHTGKLKVGKLDADAHQEIMMHYNIMSIPTLILFKGGEVKERIVGFKSKEDLMAKFAAHLA
jgi:thioredoxin 1